MKHLLRGIAEFRRTERAARAAQFERLARGQQPDTIAFTCSDSRISPMEFASSEPGDVFVVRNVGNLVPPFEPGAALRASSAGAAIEYALAMLPVEHVVVCGHSDCGAIHAIHEGKAPEGSPSLVDWLDYGRKALERVPPAPPGVSTLDHLSQHSALAQLDSLRTYPAVRDRERDGRLRLHAWWFDVARADVLEFDRDARRFVVLDESRIARRLADLDAAQPPRG